MKSNLVTYDRLVSYYYHKAKRENAIYIYNNRSLNDNREIDMLYKLVAKELAKEDPDDAIVLPVLSFQLISKCNLKCKNCAFYSPYLKNEIYHTYDQFVEMTNKALTIVDQVQIFGLCGGEVLLHKELAKMIEFLLKQPKIRNISIVSNGTIIPNEDILKQMRGAKRCYLQISGENHHRSKLNEIKELCNKNDVAYVVYNDREWRDFSDLSNRNFSEEQLEKGFKRCDYACFELFNNKIYYCCFAAINDYLNKLKVDESECLNLEEETSVLREKLKNILNMKYISSCRFCENIADNFKKVIPYEQL